MQDVDLFDWCVMYLDDESVEVRVTALRAMRQCDEADVDVVLPLAESEEKRVRGAALAVLALRTPRRASVAKSPRSSRGLTRPKTKPSLNSRSMTRIPTCRVSRTN